MLLWVPNLLIRGHLVEAVYHSFLGITHIEFPKGDVDISSLYEISLQKIISFNKDNIFYYLLYKGD